ncbi:TrbL/VirB6 plasmid conjugal transfer protein [Tenacibaculum sp. MAR_2009_124]|uniref:type IV secretion system protein n=1 Tax=Tenacibaculum sp. MAR_2009_124 TaxID=1250059 RepID=UPI00089604AB|nr:type IV secretion system protein [Tenacibaculum sp. MAR_2009_124]SEC65492.1 TrbL/VirB6 plasmid conjugal transfer protein [Tenacibaculum sp. MAR_2009_124]
MVLVTENPGMREMVNSLFNRYISDAFANVNVFVEMGQIFAHIGIAIIALQLFISEDRTNVFKALKWVPLAALLFMYKEFVGAIFQFYNNIGSSLQHNDITWDTIFNKISVAQNYNIEASGIGVGPSLLFNPSALEGVIMTQIVTILVYLGAGISTIIFIGVKAMSVIYLFVLIVFGPLNIGLSFIPALSGMWKSWLQKFMSVCLWIPILYLIDNFMLGVMDNVISRLLHPENIDTGMVLTGTLLIFMNAFIYLKAPTLANFVVQGMNVGASQLKDKPKQKGKKAVQAAMDAKTGGASKAVRTIFQ